MQEKLQHFYDVSVESAKAEAQAELDAYQAELDRSLESYKKTRLSQLELERKMEKENVRRQLNQKVSAEQFRLRREASRQLEEKKEELFAAAKERLQQFRDQPEYVDYLYAHYRKALDFAGHDSIQLLLSSGDAEYRDELSRRLGHPITVLESDFGGGICAVILSRNLQIDESFVTLLDTERQSYLLGGGATHG